MEVWQELLEQLRSHGGMQVAVEQGQLPAPFAEVTAEFRVDGHPVVSATGRVVHIGDDGEVSLMFEGAEKEALLDADLESADFEDGPIAGAIDDRPLWVRYDEMSTPEKMKLARRGGVDARRLVLKDRNPALQIHLLKNPGLSGKEVASLIRAGGANASFIRRLAQRKDLMSSPSLVEALVKYPGTPIPLAVKLVGRLNLDVVRRIAKRGKLRMPIVKAARKRVIKR